MSRHLRLLLILCSVLHLGGCYMLQAAQGQMSLLAKRQPIVKVIASQHTDAPLRARLKYAQAARHFAVTELHLPDNLSYTSFVQLDRPYVLWNVLAAPAFSVEPLQWCFPIAGCVVYRGYFSERRAQQFALKLRTQGKDALVSGVPAYSTLGHFNDPLVSSMLDWSDMRLAATLFHELSHQLLYVPGDSAFNEAFATLVEEEGLERWLITQHRAEDLRRWRLQQSRAAAFTALLLETRQQLQTLYRSDLSPQVMADRKQQLLGMLKFQYRQLRDSWQGYAGYDSWFDRTLSNADFVAIATYQHCVPGFKRLLQQVGNDLPRFYEAAKALARQSRTARQQLCEMPVATPASQEG